MKIDWNSSHQLTTTMKSKSVFVKCTQRWLPHKAIVETRYPIIASTNSVLEENLSISHIADNINDKKTYKKISSLLRNVVKIYKRYSRLPRVLLISCENNNLIFKIYSSKSEKWILISQTVSKCSKHVQKTIC